MNQNISTRSWNPLVTSREGLLTNEVQNGVTIARNYDALARPTGYACRSADEEGETRSSPEPGDQGVRLSALVGTGAEDMRDNDFPIPARSPSVREAVSTASGFRRDSGFSPRSGLAVHKGGGVPYELEYSYDAYGRLSTISSGDDVFTYSYFPGTDLVSGMASSTGYAWERTYEPDRNLIAYVENSFGDAVVSRFDYTNDEIGRRAAIARSGAAFSSLSGAVDAYGYNGRSEVTSARRTLGGDEVRGFAFDYAYDPIGNRTSSAEYDENGIRRLSLYESNELNEYTRRTVAGHATVLGEADADAEVTVNGTPAWRKGPYFYGGANVFNATNAVFAELEVEAVRDLGNGTNAVDSAVVSRFVPETPERFTYDADGNMTSDGRWTYTWNGENRLVRAVEAVHPTNRAPRVVEYAYDHRGRMVWKSIGGTNGPPDTALAYVWDDYNIVRERKNGEDTYNIWGLDLDGTMQGCGGVGGLLAVVKNGEVYTPTYDANGNISEYVDSSGTIIAHQEYDPFGNAVISSGDATAFTHWFSTKPWCGVTGMVEYQYRKYRPGIGRWMSRDRVADAYESNRYSFVRNRSVFRLDYLGLIYFDPVYGPDPCEPPYAPLNIGTLIPPQSKVDVTHTPDTSDGLSYNEAIGAYYFGGGRDLTVPFEAVDQNYGLSVFPIDICQEYPNGGPINPRTIHVDLIDISPDIAGPGGIEFVLTGEIEMGEGGCWTFDGAISVKDNKFDFDPKPWGIRDGTPSWKTSLAEKMLIVSGISSGSRIGLLAAFGLMRYHFLTYKKEGVTRFVHDLDTHTPIVGKEFTVEFGGERQIHEEGQCEKP